MVKGQISGYIYDSKSKEPLPFCNIICKSTNKGTTTNIDGKFEINTKIKSTLHISFIGYKSKNIVVNKDNIGKIYLKPQSRMINEVRIVMKEDPAVIIMRETIKRKKELRPKRDDFTEMQIQDLLKVYLSDPNHKIPILKKSKLFVQMSDSMAGGVPFFISDKRLYKDSLISQKDYGVGIEHDFFIDYINSLNFNYDIYDNLINVMGRSFASPLSNNAFSFYKFYLTDSSFIDNKYCYKIKITSKRKNNAVFLGDIWIEKNTFKVKKINLSLKDKYVNLVEGFNFSQYFDGDDDIQFESSNSVEFSIVSDDLPIISDSISLRIKRQIRRFEFNQEPDIQDSILNSEEVLSEILIMDSLNDDPNIKFITKLTEICLTSFYTVGKIDFGPIYNIYSSNKVEGKRPSFLFRTNKNFMKNLLFSSYIGYGTKDKRFKYGGELKIRDKKEKSLEIALNFENYIESMDDKYIYRVIRPNLFQTSGNDVFTSILSGMQEDKMLYFKQSKITIKKEFGNLDISTYLAKRITEKNPTLLVSSEINQSTLGIGFRFSKSKKVKNHFNTFNVKSSAPLFSGDIAISDKKIFNSDYNIIKAKLIVRQNFNTTFLGRTRYILDIGYYKISDETPLMFLEYHRGNESFMYDLTKSSLMNQNEFVSDRYIALYIDQHLNGKIFNHIPLLNRLEIRETITANIIFGNLHNISLKNNLPNLSHAMNYNTPYAEVGVGIENIFKLIRVSCVWRLSHLDKPASTPFGVIAGFYFNF
jgi:hypothetical protein